MVSSEYLRTRARVYLEKFYYAESTQFLEAGWTVDLSYNDQAKLPNKLILKQALESGQENRITMVIQNR